MKVAVDYRNNDITGFKYQSCHTEVEVADHDFSNEEVFTESQQSRFCVINGVVHKKTDEEIKAEPKYVEYIRNKRQKRYEKEVDPLTLEAIRVGVSTSAGIELKKQANEKVAQIKLELPKE